MKQIESPTPVKLLVCLREKATGSRKFKSLLKMEGVYGIGKTGLPGSPQISRWNS